MECCTKSSANFFHETYSANVQQINILNSTEYNQINFKIGLNSNNKGAQMSAITPIDNYIAFSHTP